MLVPPTIPGRVNERIVESGAAPRTTCLMLDEIPIQQLTPELKEILEQCTKLEYLSLDSCSLQSLQSMPQLVKLQVIELNNNKLTDGSLNALTQFIKLRRIFIRDNAIGQLESLSCLAKLQDLIQIELKGNPITDIINYRESLYRIKSLEIVDGRDRDGNEMQDLSEYSSENTESEDEPSDMGESVDENNNSSNNGNDDPEDISDIARKQRKLN